MSTLRLLACASLLSACTGVISAGGEGDLGPGATRDGVPIDPITGRPIGESGSGGDGLSPGAGDGDGDGDGDGQAGNEAELEQACATLDVGLTPLRRLTRTEYNTTMGDLLGDTTKPADQFAPDEKLLGFDAGLNVSRLLVEQYMSAAELLATAAAEDLPGLLGCDPAVTGEDECMAEFIARFGRRAYRRPLSADERTELETLYGTAKTEYGFRSGVELTLQAMLQSPDFLYRAELGTETDVANVKQLDGYEMATRLSYFFHRSTPSDALLDAAEAGELDTADGVTMYARQLLDDPRSHATVDSFHEQWLELDRLLGVGKDSAIYPEFDDGMRAAMRQETLRFAEYVMFDGESTVRELLTAPFSFITTDLADLYGLSGSYDDVPTRVELDGNERRGILTQASVLSVHAKANQSSPVHRGKFVRERILCQQLSPPPADLVIVPPDPSPDASTRERFAEHSANDECRGCHVLMDPIGFGFENYDGIGRYREMDGTFAVDASGELIGTRDIDGEFEGAVELAEQLASSEEVRECVADQWFVYTFGRSASNALDACSREQLYSAFGSEDSRMSELLIALTSTNAFRYVRTDLDEGDEP